MERVILHCDANAFYASVECLYTQSIRHPPLAVSGSVEERHGIVLTKNQIAKQFGVQTGEAIWQARQKCPDLICVPPDYGLYIRFSKCMRRIYEEYSDRVESFGLDEAWIDLSNPGLTIRDGDVYGIIGMSGAGKSTLVRCLNLLERPTEGAILYDGRDITGLSGRALLELRSQVGMIFQNFSLFQQRTVLRNVTFPLELRGEKGEAARKRAMELLELVGLADLAERYPSQLSGGQQQRVAIARALANNPKVMLCDEATSALDTRTTASILQLLQDINRELGVTLVVITHSLPAACKICNRVAVIDHGRIVEEGATAAVFGNPQSPVTRELLANDDMLAAIERDAEKGQEG